MVPSSRRTNRSGVTATISAVSIEAKNHGSQSDDEAIGAGVPGRDCGRLVPFGRGSWHSLHADKIPLRDVTINDGTDRDLF